MMTTLIIILLSIYAIFTTVIVLIISKRADELLQEIQTFKIEKGKLSNAVRLKGDEVTRLIRQILKLRKESEKI